MLAFFHLLVRNFYTSTKLISTIRAFGHLLSLPPLLPVKRDQGTGHLNALAQTLTLDNPAT